MDRRGEYEIIGFEQIGEENELDETAFRIIRISISGMLFIENSRIDRVAQ